MLGGGPGLGGDWFQFFGGLHGGAQGVPRFLADSSKETVLSALERMTWSSSGMSAPSGTAASSSSGPAEPSVPMSPRCLCAALFIVPGREVERLRGMKEECVRR